MEIVTMKDIYEQNEKILELLGEKDFKKSTFNYSDFVNVKSFIEDAEMKTDKEYTITLTDYKNTLMLVQYKDKEYKLRPPRWMIKLRPFQSTNITVKVVRKAVRQHLQLIKVNSIETPFG